MKKWTLILVIFLSGCIHRQTVKEVPDNQALLDQAKAFYSFILDREIGIWHNDQEKEFMEFFLDNNSYYDFMDTYLYVLRDRNIYRNTISHYYVQGVTVAEDGNSADVKVKLYSRDAPLLYRKIEATQTWNKVYDKWYPGKIDAPKLNWYQKYTEIYGLPPWD